MGVDLGRTHEESGRGTSLDQPGSLLALGCPEEIEEINFCSASAAPL